MSLPRTQAHGLKVRPVHSPHEVKPRWSNPYSLLRLRTRQPLTPSSFPRMTNAHLMILGLGACPPKDPLRVRDLFKTRTSGRSPEPELPHRCRPNPPPLQYHSGCWRCVTAFLISNWALLQEETLSLLITALPPF